MRVFVIIIYLELSFTRYSMAKMTLQQIIDQRTSFFGEQFSPYKKPEVNSTFQLQIDAIRSVDDMEKAEAIICKKSQNWS